MSAERSIIGTDQATAPCSLCGVARPDGARVATLADPAVSLFICSSCCYALEEVAGYREYRV